MKRLFTLLLISFAALSCEMIDEKLDDLLDKRDWVVFAEGTELSVDVPSKQTVLNYKFESTLDWEVKTDAEWLEIDPMRGKAGKDIKIQIKVAKNKDKEGRTGHADLTLSNDESYRITINQAGEGDENEDEDVIVDIPNNQIWYTSIDDEIVEPYSGDGNNYADAFTSFGVNIVSNTYADGKGVIEFEGDVTIIGDYAFLYCSSLTSVTIPDSVTTIGDGAFGVCYGLTSVNIGDSVTMIGEDAFAECSSLTSVTIPDSVTTIGGCAFNYCDNLTSVTIPDSVTTIGRAAFARCNRLTEFKGKFASEDGRCLIIDGTLNSFAPAGLTEYTIPNSVTTIGYPAFQYCESLTSITIPDSVTAIENYTFSGCSSLTSVTIPDSVTTIGWGAFGNCSSLTSVYISDISAWCNISFFYSVYNPFNLYLNNELVTDLTIPDSVTTIGWGAFGNCSSLTSVTIPDSVTTIEEDAFYGCSSLTSINIPDSVTTIGGSAFGYCRSLTSVTIGDSVTTIGYGAFEDCYSLTSVYCKPTTPPVGGYDMFYNNASGRKIYVPIESVEAYMSAEGWSEYADDIVGYDFDRNEEVVQPEQPEQPEEIPNDQIWYTSTDGEIVEPYSGEYNEYADALKTFGVNIVSNTYVDGKGVIEFDGVVTIIGDWAFFYCSSLTSVTIPDSVTEIGWSAFEGCSSLTSVTIPNSVTTIRDVAFEDCSSLTSVTIGDSLTTIGEGAFVHCSSLTSVIIPDSVTTIGKEAFYDCDSLTSVTIPDSVTTIGHCAFEDCSSLTSVTIGDSVTTIGDQAFAFCYDLASVYCKATTPPVIGSSMFLDNASGRKIYVSMESVEAYKSAEYWCDYAEDIVGYNF